MSIFQHPTVFGTLQSVTGRWADTVKQMFHPDTYTYIFVLRDTMEKV